MFEAVKIVLLETVEITDVTISSRALLKDLQANFRENMKRTAKSAEWMQLLSPQKSPTEDLVMFWGSKSVFAEHRLDPWLSNFQTIRPQRAESL